MRPAAHARPAPEMNTTPLIDVLLVLLVLLVITLPISTHKVSLNLPGGAAKPAPPLPTVQVDIDFDGKVFWNGSPAESDELLERWFRQTALDPLTPVVHIVPDRGSHYERVAQVLAAAQRAHVSRIDLSPVSD